MNKIQSDQTDKIGWWRGTFGMRCREASALISQSADRPLTHREKIFMTAHLCGCRWCRRYRLQVRMINHVVAAWGSEENKQSGMKLPPEARLRILDQLR